MTTLNTDLPYNVWTEVTSATIFVAYNPTIYNINFIWAATDPTASGLVPYSLDPRETLSRNFEIGSLWALNDASEETIKLVIDEG